jgi:hypothetical protein
MQRGQDVCGRVVGQPHAMAFDLEFLWHGFDIMQPEHRTRISVKIASPSDAAHVLSWRQIPRVKLFQAGDLVRGAFGELRHADHLFQLGLFGAVALDEHELFSVEVENGRLQAGQQALGNVVRQLHAMAFDLEFGRHAVGI